MAYDEVRAKVRAFINAREDREIIFVRGTTEAINLVAHSFGRGAIGPGDEDRDEVRGERVRIHRDADDVIVAGDGVVADFRHELYRGVLAQGSEERIWVLQGIGRERGEGSERAALGDHESSHVRPSRGSEWLHQKEGQSLLAWQLHQQVVREHRVCLEHAAKLWVGTC